MTRFLKSKRAEILLLALLSALIYLPLVGKIGFNFDDWYLMYAAKVKGVSIFHTIFSVDRPLRAFVMIPAYALFAENTLWYHLAAYFFRLLGAVSFLWSLRLVWGEEKQELPTFLMALFFLVYPGFLSQPNAIDYLSHQVALALAPFSIGLSLLSLLASGKWQRRGLFLLSILLGGIYLGIMEYYIGIEALRFALIFVILWRPPSNSPRGGENFSMLKKLWQVIWRSIPYLLASLPFLYWRIFLFESARGATDTTQQFSGFFASPLGFMRLWGIRLIEDFFKTLFGAWQIPFAQFYAHYEKLLNTVNFLLGFLLAFALLYFLYDRFFAKEKYSLEGWQSEVLLTGIFALFISLLPVVLVNRQVGFPHYSRYTLPGSFGAVMILMALIFLVHLKFAKETIFALLLFIASATHIANAQKYAAETASMNAFWWQVSWRVPQLDQRTTLMVNYPVVSTQEDYFIWGPANQIYYPAGTDEEKVVPGIYALILNDENIQKVIARERQEYVLRRGTETYPNARNVLIFSQPSLNSCVHVIDGFAPEYSPFESEKVMQIGEFSEVEHIFTDADFHTPPEAVFGPEPAHTWCYFYQKATLARQTENWDLVADLLTEASQKGSVPHDPVEWMPFIQASAILGDVDQFRAISSQIENEFVSQQACETLMGMELTPEMRRLAVDSYCALQ